MGTTLGIKVGRQDDGRVVGSNVGLHEGEVLGLFDGVCEGRDVGFAVGSKVGVMEGIVEGNTLGE